jgi:hypothetical protein
LDIRDGAERACVGGRRSCDGGQETEVTMAIQHPNRLDPGSANAVTWVSPRRAVVARRGRDGQIRVDHLERSVSQEDEEQFLIRVALDLGPAQRVLVMGPVLDRVRFERVDVAIHRRPERLVDEPGETFEAPTAEQLEPILALRRR